jgi:hypothetical protein
MLEIDNTLVSLDLITSNFACNLQACKGACCVTGDSGAPLETEEAKKLQEIYPALKAYLRNESVVTIETLGTSVIDIESDTVTPLNDGKECAYTLFEDGIARCAIEKAYNEGVIDFRKPVSCYLYPVRIKKYQRYDAVNYDRWEICRPAIKMGNEINRPVYLFVKDALCRHYGEAWFTRLETAAKELEITRDPSSD